MQFDTNGREYAKIDTIAPGDELEVDDNFTCLGGRKRVRVYENLCGLYVFCVNSYHFLDGQDEGDGYLIGMYPVIN